MLAAACLISVWLQNYTDAILIAIILFINSGLGFFRNTDRNELLRNCRSLSANKSSQNEMARFFLKNEHGLEFLGYASFLDPLRPTAKDTIRQAEKLGIAIKILTGDSREVAEYIGKEVGLISGGQVVYTGDELEAMPRDLQTHRKK